MPRRHSIEYEWVLNSERWREVRAEALRRAQFRCQQCGASGVESRLDAHHWLGYSMLGNERPEDLRILCRPCHDRVHRPGIYATNLLKVVVWVLVLVCVFVLVAHLVRGSLFP